EPTLRSGSLGDAGSLWAGRVVADTGQVASVDVSAVRPLQLGHAAVCREQRRRHAARITTEQVDASSLAHPTGVRLLNALAASPAALDRSRRRRRGEPLLTGLSEVSAAIEDWLGHCRVTPTIDEDITARHASRITARPRPSRHHRPRRRTTTTGRFGAGEDLMPAHIAGTLHATPAPVWLPYPDDVNALLPSLWSDNVTKTDEGVLTIAGRSVTELAAEYGTPTLIMDAAVFRSRAQAYASTFANAFSAEKGLAGADVYYAGKAFLCTAVARWVHEAGLGLDTCSLGEMMVARTAGVPGDRVGLHGNNKSVAELEYALDYGVGRIFVDSLDEIDRLDTIAGARGVLAPVMLRVTVGVEAHTHDFIATAHEDQKFGLSLADGTAARAAQKVADSAHLRLDGLPSHFGSQIFDISGFQGASARVLGFRADVMAEHGIDLPEVDLGGGFGIRYTSQDTPIPVAEMATELAAVVAKECRGLGTNVPRISIEPGRAIVSPAVFTLYEVGTVKQVSTDSGIRTYVAVDGGMSDNIRTALYDADYSCTLANRASSAEPAIVRVVGKHCESGDIIVRDEYMGADVTAGDLVAVPSTGAYCRPLASNYNHIPRPGVLAVDADRVEWIVLPEDHSQMFATDPGMADGGPSSR